MFFVLFSYLILLRLGELILADRNRRWAMKQGGLESDRRQYLVIVAVHTLFYLSLWLEWKYWSHGWNALWPIWLGLLAGAQIVRFWAILALGRYWNTRIIVLPQMKLVTRGPYRFIRHPNYLAVIIEFVATAAMQCPLGHASFPATRASSPILNDPRGLQLIGKDSDPLTRIEQGELVREHGIGGKFAVQIGK